MPPRRKYMRRRRKAAKPAWLSYIKSTKAVTNTGALAWSAYKGMRRIQRLINVEFKKYDEFTANAAYDSSGAIISLNAVPQGDTDSTRNGNSIKPMSIYMKFSVYNNATATATLTRFMLIIDKQTVSDTAPTVASILDVSAGNSFVDAPLNNETVGRFKVLKDKRVLLDSVRANRKDFTLYQKLFGHMRYNGANGGDIQKNALFLLIVSDQPTNTPTVTFNHRLTFVDN